jgi:glycosyltransferase involved in cell wall biosynthesis
MTAAPGSIAVVIPTRNGAPFIGETLRSVLSQSRRPDAIVVVNDGSTDETADIVASFESVLLLPNGGSGSNPARATAIAATESEYLAFLDHDDLWFPHHLETLAGLLDKSPHPAAFSRARVFGTAFEPEPVRAGTSQLVNLWDRFPVNLVGGPSSVVARRSALEHIGGWPTWNRVPSDIYVWFRLADLGPFLRWPTATAGWRRHEASQSSSFHREDPVGYARGRLELLHEALDVHLVGRRDDGERLTCLLDEFGELVDVLATMCLGNVDALPATLDYLARRNSLSDDAILSIWAVFLSAATRDSAAGRNIWRSYGAWPRERRDLRRQIVDPVLAHAVVSGVRRSPLHPSRWGLPVEPDVRNALRPLAGAIAQSGWRRLRRATGIPR